MDKVNLIELLVINIIKYLSVKDLVIVGIDGPTASGKTILANNLGLRIKENGYNYDFYRLDWQLKRREERLKDLSLIHNNQNNFNFEGELHMHLDEFKKFLKEINYIERDLSMDKKVIKHEIKNLYSRETNGKRTAQHQFEIRKKTIIICEGHYTSRAEFSKYIDFNICLLSKHDELLRRKIERVKNYRNEKDAIEYFYKIDIPSFNHHLEKSKNNIDLVINNTNWDSPVMESKLFINNWIKNSEKLIRKTQIKNKSLFKIYQRLFYDERINTNLEYKIFSEIIKFNNSLRKIYQEKMLFSIEESKKDIDSQLYFYLNKLIKKLHKINDNISLEIESKNNLNISPRERSCPLSIGLRYRNNLNRYNSYLFLFSIYINVSEILISWKGSSEIIYKNFYLSKIENENSSKKINSQWEFIKKDIKTINKSKIKVITPTDFCIPEFIKGLAIKKIFSKKEHELTVFYDLLKILIIEKNSILIHRFSTFKEQDFYKEIINNFGLRVIGIGNYLITINSNNPDLVESFKNWTINFRNDDKNLINYKNHYDKKVKQELDEARNLIYLNYDNFFLKDNFLVFKNINKEQNNNDIINELRNMFNSDNRILRKKAFEFIYDQFPNIEFTSEEVLNTYALKIETNKKNNIPLKDIPFLFPTILAEFYLWENLRGSENAILGANIYDLDQENSLDAQALLSATSSANTAIVLQASLNAIGEKIIYDNKFSEGYLSIKDGSNTLIESVIKSSIQNFFIFNKKPSLYGIGIDHIDSKNDSPNGRCIKFLTKSIKNKNLTHIVLDGSSKFSAKNRSLLEIRKAYKKVIDFEVSLLEKNKDSFLIDKEYCIGELNYTETSKEALIPTCEEINLFINLLIDEIDKKGISYENCRPSLFIGNLGTVHHGKDNKKIESGISYNWVEKIKKYGFYSAVLHGTTNSQKQTLIDATRGCHKINIAGDLLKVYLESLPEWIDPEMKLFNSEAKYKMKEIRNIKKKFSLRERNLIKKNIINKAKSLFSTIKSPILTERDKKYFHRFSYSMNSKFIELILNKYKEKIDKNFGQN
ncbi:hypothetical protein OA981_02240, partial [Prochlorococcus sp. AH-716-A09]|nr:hypothetical protein [Prochlorococcus sp. AH-716-A09]